MQLAFDSMLSLLVTVSLEDFLPAESAWASLAGNFLLLSDVTTVWVFDDSTGRSTFSFFNGTDFDDDEGR
jgi:hypothetical protein